MDKDPVCLITRWLAQTLLLAAALCACQRQTQDAAAVPHTPIPKAEPRLTVVIEGSQLRYEGVVADEDSRAAIAAALESAVPGAEGTLAVQPRTRPATWAGRVDAAAAALRRSGGRLDFAGRRIALSGQLTQEQRATLRRQIERLYPGHALAGGFEGIDMRKALPEAGDMQALLSFLNAVPVAFQAGTGMLTPTSVEALARAARGLQAAGPETRIEMRLYPDAGTTRPDRDIARQRIDALLVQLAMRGIAPARLRAIAMPADPGRNGTVEFAPFPDGAEPTPIGDQYLGAASPADPATQTPAAASPDAPAERTDRP